MYQNNNHSDFHKLGIQQQVSLDKHSEMIRNATRWNNLPQEQQVEEQPVVIRRLQLAWSTAMNLLTLR